MKWSPLEIYRIPNVEVKRELLRNNGLTFLLIKNEYIYTKPKTQKIGNKPRIKELQQKIGSYN